MTTKSPVEADRLDQALDAFPDSFLKLLPAAQRVSLAIYRLLARAEPVPPSAIAAEVGVSEEQVHKLLDSWSGVYRDAEGRIVGYWGLTPSKMDHRLDVGGRTVYAWCAWDALFIPALLGLSAQVVSKSPGTEKPIRLTVSPEGARSLDEQEVYVSFLEPPVEETLAEDVIGSFCHYVFFFPSRAAGLRWTASHPGTYLLTLDEAFELGRRKNARQYPDTHPALPAPSPAESASTSSQPAPGG